MDKQRRKELLEGYRQLKTYMGVIQVRNMINGKIFIDAFPNLKNKWLTLSGQMETGRHPNADFQKDWKLYGKDAFCYEVLEEKETDKIADVKWEMKQMEKVWMEKLQPYGDRGYNRPPIY